MTQFTSDNLMTVTTVNDVVTIDSRYETGDNIILKLGANQADVVSGKQLEDLNIREIFELDPEIVFLDISPTEWAHIVFDTNQLGDINIVEGSAFSTSDFEQIIIDREA